jgi:hypothetical protein
MYRKSFGVVAGLGVLLAAGTALAEWPSLNPFAAKPQNVSQSNSGSWWPSWGSSQPRRGPTTWQKVQAAPGNMMTRTKDTLAPLNPWRPEPKPMGPKLGSNKPKKKSEESGWWPKWMTVEEEKQPPLTVSDWLDAPRPGF